MRIKMRALNRPVFALLVAGLAAAAAYAVSSAGTQRAELEADSDLTLAEVNTFTDFALYYPGESFAGMPLTNINRAKYHSPEAPGPADYVAFTYGGCIPASDTGCPFPLEVQVWAACARNPSMYTFGFQPNAGEATKVRGAAAAFFEDGGRLEVYSGDVTIVLFADEQAQLLNAAEQLVPANAEAVALQEEALRSGLTADEEDLPPPTAGAMEGQLKCDV